MAAPSIEQTKKICGKQVVNKWKEPQIFTSENVQKQQQKQHDIDDYQRNQAFLKNQQQQQFQKFEEPLIDDQSDQQLFNIKEFNKKYAQNYQQNLQQNTMNSQQQVNIKKTQKSENLVNKEYQQKYQEIQRQYAPQAYNSYQIQQHLQQEDFNDDEEVRDASQQQQKLKDQMQNQQQYLQNLQTFSNQNYTSDVNSLPNTQSNLKNLKQITTPHFTQIPSSIKYDIPNVRESNSSGNVVRNSKEYQQQKQYNQQHQNQNPTINDENNYYNNKKQQQQQIDIQEESLVNQDSMSPQKQEENMQKKKKLIQQQRSYSAQKSQQQKYNVPQHLRNVQSKIKSEVDYHKKLKKQQKSLEKYLNSTNPELLQNQQYNEYRTLLNQARLDRDESQDYLIPFSFKSQDDLIKQRRNLEYASSEYAKNNTFLGETFSDINQKQQQIFSQPSQQQYFSNNQQSLYDNNMNDNYKDYLRDIEFNKSSKQRQNDLAITNQSQDNADFYNKHRLVQQRDQQQQQSFDSFSNNYSKQKDYQSQQPQQQFYQQKHQKYSSASLMKQKKNMLENANQILNSPIIQQLTYPYEQYPTTQSELQEFYNNRYQRYLDYSGSQQNFQQQQNQYNRYNNGNYYKQYNTNISSQTGGVGDSFNNFNINYDRFSSSNQKKNLNYVSSYQPSQKLSSQRNEQQIQQQQQYLRGGEFQQFNNLDEKKSDSSGFSKFEYAEEMRELFLKEYLRSTGKKQDEEQKQQQQQFQSEQQQNEQQMSQQQQQVQHKYNQQLNDNSQGQDESK